MRSGCTTVAGRLHALEPGAGEQRRRQRSGERRRSRLAGPFERRAQPWSSVSAAWVETFAWASTEMPAC